VGSTDARPRDLTLQSVDSFPADLSHTSEFLISESGVQVLIVKDCMFLLQALAMVGWTRVMMPERVGIRNYLLFIIPIKLVLVLGRGFYWLGDSDAGLCATQAGEYGYFVLFAQVNWSVGWCGHSPEFLFVHVPICSSRHSLPRQSPSLPSQYTTVGYRHHHDNDDHQDV
jgi:hypothetical protein